MAQKRIQLRRTRGWRMPPNTIKIDRSTRWGNPFRVGQDALHPVTNKVVHVHDVNTAVSLFAIHVVSSSGAALVAAAQRELRGKDLACWCKENHTCHGDVLLKVANTAIAQRRAA